MQYKLCSIIFIFSLVCAIFLLGACEGIDMEEESETVEPIVIKPPFSLLNKKYRIYGYFAEGKENDLVTFKSNQLSYKAYLRRTYSESDYYTNKEGYLVLKPGINTEPIQDNSYTEINCNYKTENEIEYLEILSSSDSVEWIEIQLFMNDNEEYKIILGIMNDSLFTGIEIPNQQERLYLKIEQI